MKGVGLIHLIPVCIYERIRAEAHENRAELTTDWLGINDRTALVLRPGSGSRPITAVGFEVPTNRPLEGCHYESLNQRWAEGRVAAGLVRHTPMTNTEYGLVDVHVFWLGLKADLWIVYIWSCWMSMWLEIETWKRTERNVCQLPMGVSLDEREDCPNVALWSKWQRVLYSWTLLS